MIQVPQCVIVFTHSDECDTWATDLLLLSSTAGVRGQTTTNMSDIENLPPESRLDIKDVPEQISRIFFGQPGGNRPSYLDDGYGSPLFPPISDPGFPGAGYPIYYQGN